jgi:hypothetical protein
LPACEVRSTADCAPPSSSASACGYTYRWVRPRDELGITTAQIAALDPVRRQLLGEGTSAIGYWLPTEEDVPLRAIG